MAWLTGWTYRKEITLSRASGAVTNYQMKILVGESSGSGINDVHCEGNCLSNFNDLRFTNSDETTLLDYWIESISGTTPNQVATVWVEFDSIGTGATTFYMYYGKVDATAYSNGENTFLFFDHFDGNLSKWGGDGALSISGSILTLRPPSDGWYWNYGNVQTGPSTALRAKAQINAVGYASFGLAKTGVTAYSLLQNDSSGANISILTSGSSVATNVTLSQYKIIDIVVDGNVNTRVFENGVESLNSPKTTNPTNSNELRATIGGYKSGADNVLCDWVLLRQYLATEPSWGYWGDEEGVATTAAPTTSPPDGTVCWGHDTGVVEANKRTFSGNWSGTAYISGAGDAERIDFDSGENEESETWEIGPGRVRITIDKYASGYGSPTVKYKSGNSQANCEADSWHDYTVPFVTTGWIKIRIEA